MDKIALEKVGPGNLSDCGIGCLTDPKNQGYQPKIKWHVGALPRGCTCCCCAMEKAGRWPSSSTCRASTPGGRWTPRAGCLCTVNDLSEMAAEHGLELKVTVLNNAREAQDAPSYYGVFSLVWNARLLSDHYVSKGRFKNLLRKEILRERDRS